jgi:hypothetical protein
MKPEDAPVFNALNDSEAAVLTIYGEARGEIFAGKQAVAQVIANRAAKHKQNIKEVVYAPNQFSCLISTDPNYPKLRALAGDFKTVGLDDLFNNVTDGKVLQECVAAWKGDRSEVAGRINGATFYEVHGTKNEWFDKMKDKGKLVYTASFGSHDFYKET